MVLEAEIIVERSRFTNPLDCSYATFKKPVSLRDSVFNMGVTFTVSTFEKDMFLEKAIFKEAAEFSGIRVIGNAQATETTFEGEANFGSAQIGSTAEFAGAVFKVTAIFASVHVEQFVVFDGASFEKNVSFQNSRFGTVFFGPHDNQTSTCSLGDGVTIDWRGCTYDRIHPTSAREELMERLDPYDRQPYTHLEGVFRRSGDDREATRVYYRRKCVESRRLKLFQRTPFERHVVRWLADRFLMVAHGLRRPSQAHSLRHAYHSGAWHVCISA
jgi:hypothetical protein